MSIVHKYLVYENPLLKKSDEDEEINVLIKVKTSIVELLSLYVTRYADIFQPLIQTFITSVWELVNNYVTKQPKYDLLVVKSLQFLTSVIKIPEYQSLFQQENSINEIIEKSYCQIFISEKMMKKHLKMNQLFMFVLIWKGLILTQEEKVPLISCVN